MATRVSAPPLRSLTAFFAVRGAFAPTSVEVKADSLNSTGILTLPGGARRRAILAIERRTPVSRGMLLTRRFSYGCGPADPAEPPAVFYREIDAAIRPVLSRLAAGEKRVAALWRRAARVARADPACLDVLEEAMGRPLAASFVVAAAAVRGRVLDLGVHLRAGCLQRCLFCRREPKRFDGAAHDGDLATVKEIMRRVVRPAVRRGVDVRFRLEADDLAGHGRLDEIAALLAAETAAGLHVVIPPNRLADPTVARRIAALPGIESVMLTLFGCTPRTHDAVAGRPGAFHELLRGAGSLRAAGTVTLSFNAVLTAQAVGELGGILDVARLLRSRLIVSSLFADWPGHHAKLAAIVPDLGALRGAFGREERRIAEEGVRLQDFPVCALPPALRPLNANNRVLRRDDYPALPVCATCLHRPRCCGVPRGYLDAHGAGELRPETAAGGGHTRPRGRRRKAGPK